MKQDSQMLGAQKRGDDPDKFTILLYQDICSKFRLICKFPALQIVKEMADKQLPVNRQLLSSFVKFFVVARHPQGILDTLNDMRTRGMYPSSNLLEMALRRLEREGHRSGITQVHIEIGRRNWRSYSAERMVSWPFSAASFSIKGLQWVQTFFVIQSILWKVPWQILSFFPSPVQERPKQKSLAGSMGHCLQFLQIV